jgi:hypothetical protein
MLLLSRRCAPHPGISMCTLKLKLKLMLMLMLMLMLTLTIRQVTAWPPSLTKDVEPAQNLSDTRIGM